MHMCFLHRYSEFIRDQGCCKDLRLWTLWYILENNPAFIETRNFASGLIVFIFSWNELPLSLVLLHDNDMRQVFFKSKLLVVLLQDLINKVWFYDLSGNPIGEIEGPPNSAFGSAPMSVQISGSGSTQAIFITATSGDGEGLNFGDVWIYDQNLSLIGRLSGFDRGSFGTFVLVS